jgi:uncharacterized membrane protein YphA (DoxX/SURF4 family)
MSGAATTLSVVVGVFYLFAGTLKLSGIPQVRERAAGLNLPFERYRLFGVAEVLAGAGLLIGLSVPELARAAALFLALLMVVLVGLHVRAGSGAWRLVPPVACCVATIALTVLLIAI